MASPFLMASTIRRPTAARFSWELPRGAWKQEIQPQLCDGLGLCVIPSHYPSWPSKWNPIGHRSFSPISRNQAAEPLDSYEKAQVHPHHHNHYRIESDCTARYCLLSDWRQALKGRTQPTLHSTETCPAKNGTTPSRRQCGVAFGRLLSRTAVMLCASLNRDRAVSVVVVDTSPRVANDFVIDVAASPGTIHSSTAWPSRRPRIPATSEPYPQRPMTTNGCATFI
jgi:Rhodopirellula transposase DDE domain